MQQIYADWNLGNDTNPGTSALPKKTLGGCLAIVASSTEIILRGAVPTTYTETQLLRLPDLGITPLTNINIRAENYNVITISGDIDASVDRIFEINNCKNVLISGLNFVTTVPRAHMLVATNSSVNISNCSVDGWIFPPTGPIIYDCSFFELKNCTGNIDTITIKAATGFLTNANNHNWYCFNITGASRYVLNNININNIQCTQLLRDCVGIKINNEVQQFTISNSSFVDIKTVDISNLLSEHCFGVVADLNSLTDFRLDSNTFTSIADGSLIRGVSSKVNSITRSVYNNCMKGIVAIGIQLTVYNCTIDRCNYGIYADQLANIDCKNTIVSNCGDIFIVPGNTNTFAVMADNKATVNLSFVDLYNNTVNRPNDLKNAEINFSGFTSSKESWAISDGTSTYGNIQYNSEVVKSATDDSIVFKRGTDYIIDYGTASPFKGLLTITNSSEIDLGMPLMVTFTYIDSTYATTGKVTYIGYVKFVNPIYQGSGKNGSNLDPYKLDQYSPLLESGTPVGLSYIGGAPDIGRYDQERIVLPTEIFGKILQETRKSDVIIPPPLESTRDYLKARLLEDHPEIDLTDGSAITDLLIKYFVVATDQLRAEMQFLATQQTMLNYGILAQSEMDQLVSNVFVERSPGEYSVGAVRMYFMVPTNALIPINAIFDAAGGQQFISLYDQTITAEEMALNVEKDLYYFDVVIKSINKGDEYNVGAQTVFSLEGAVPQNLVRITNLTAFSSGITEEDNTALLARAKYAITVRDLNSKKAIVSLLRQLYPYINDIMVIGYRDVEMERDVVDQLLPYIGDYHFGGHTDIYVLTNELTIDTYQVDLDNNLEIALDALHFKVAPVIYIDKLERVTGATSPSSMQTTEIPKSHYDIVVKTPRLRYSMKDDSKIRFKNITENNTPVYLPNTPIKVTFRYTPNIQELQTFVYDSVNRVVCCDPLVKHFIPAMVDVHIKYKSDSPIAGLDTTIKNYITGVTAGNPIEASDIVNLVYTAGSKYVVLPISLSADIYNANGSVTTVSSPDKLTLPRIQHGIPRTITLELVS